MRVRTLCVVVALVVSGCASSGADSSTTTAPPSVQPTPSGTYSGPVTEQTGITGWVTVDVSAGGDEIVGLILAYDMTDYACGGNIVLNGPGAAAPLGISVPIVDGAFEYDSSMGISWQGNFASSTQLSGTLEGDLVSPPCPIGPLSWSAELREVRPPDGEPSTTETSSTTAANTWVVPPEYAELCSISQRIMDRVATAPSASENASDFWIAQRDDWVATVDLVPAGLRDDMGVRAEAWRQVVDLLEQYDFVFDAMLADVGVEAFNQIFLADEVVDAGARVDDFLGATCLGE
jgi:hypothetical protein